MSEVQRPEVLVAFERLLAVVARLRAPDGCPWDRQQTELSMAPHLIEECYEALEAIEAKDAAHEREELGDVLMNVLMICRIAEEGGRYDLAGVASTIADKLVRRHPHVFGSRAAPDAEAALANWETIKRAEAAPGKPKSSELPRDLPALTKAFRVGEKAARVGFDWPDARGPRAKVDEELRELDAALASGDAGAASEELGDLLFAVVNLARHAKIQPELALRGTIAKFQRRFASVEAALGPRLGSASLAEMDAAWEAAKAAERRS